MNEKPSYADLYSQVKQLEDEKDRIAVKAVDALSELGEVEGKYQAALNTVEAQISLIDADMKIIWANRRTVEMFGTDIIGKPCSSACFSHDGTCGGKSGCIVKDAFRNGTVEMRETEAVGPGGRKINLNGKAKVIQRDVNGHPRVVVKIYHDITEQKSVEAELKKSLLQLRKNLAGTIQAMAMTVETRDPYTAGHQRRTTDIARSIAREMGLAREQIDGIRMAGVIHDLGKISVPAEILSKPGKIGDTEYALIKDHPLTGYAILKGIDFKWPVAEIVRQHHERIDGSGYPHGLKGDDILLEARVIGVADVIEAMSSHRPYRPSLGANKAFHEIMQHRGTLYDPDVVDATVKLYSRRELQVQ